MFVALMDTEHFSFVALGKTEPEARRAMAQAFTRLLIYRTPGETTAEFVREVFCASVGELEGGEPIDDDEFALQLDEWYGIGVTDVPVGGATVDGDTI